LQDIAICAGAAGPRPCPRAAGARRLGRHVAGPRRCGDQDGKSRERQEAENGCSSHGPTRQHRQLSAEEYAAAGEGWSHAGSGRIPLPLSSAAPTHAASRLAQSSSQFPSAGSFPLDAGNTAAKQARAEPGAGELSAGATQPLKSKAMARTGKDKRMTDEVVLVLVPIEAGPSGVFQTSNGLACNSDIAIYLCGGRAGGCGQSKSLDLPMPRVCSMALPAAE
jgi:hypothetical protein